jgi:hypothetical protein
MKDLQTLINARADARLQADIDAAYPFVIDKFKYSGLTQHGRDLSTKITLPDGKVVELFYSGGLACLIRSQLAEQFRDQYRAAESATFLAEVTAMRERFEELTGEDLDPENES